MDACEWEVRLENGVARLIGPSGKTFCYGFRRGRLSALDVLWLHARGTWFRADKRNSPRWRFTEEPTVLPSQKRLALEAIDKAQKQENARIANGGR